MRIGSANGIISAVAPNNALNPTPKSWADTAFRWRQITALARVTDSACGYDRKDEHGHRAPGYEYACRLLGVTA